MTIGDALDLLLHGAGVGIDVDIEHAHRMALRAIAAIVIATMRAVTG